MNFLTMSCDDNFNISETHFVCQCEESFGLLVKTSSVLSLSLICQCVLNVTNVSYICLISSKTGELRNFARLPYTPCRKKSTKIIRYLLYKHNSGALITNVTHHFRSQYDDFPHVNRFEMVSRMRYCVSSNI